MLRNLFRTLAPIGARQVIPDPSGPGLAGSPFRTSSTRERHRAGTPARGLESRRPSSPKSRRLEHGRAIFEQDGTTQWLPWGGSSHVAVQRNGKAGKSLAPAEGG